MSEEDVGYRMSEKDRHSEPKPVIPNKNRHPELVSGSHFLLIGLFYCYFKNKTEIPKQVRDDRRRLRGTLAMTYLGDIFLNIGMTMKFICLILTIFILPAHANPQNVRDKLVVAALASTKCNVIYDPAYYTIKYPGGDVPAGRGVCTDVIIRTYRALGVDLQKLVHEDMKRNFALYPSQKLWGLKKPNTNIDHRRVPNLQVFFTRYGTKLKISEKAEDYQPGDIVTWNVAGLRRFIGKGHTPHIGIVVNKKSKDGKRFLVVHNIGWGHKCEDMLFDYPITGHYAYLPERK